MKYDCYWCVDCAEPVFNIEDLKEKHDGHQLATKTEEIAEILPFGGECGGG